jgi:rRNA maturation protein Nop10
MKKKLPKIPNLDKPARPWDVLNPNIEKVPTDVKESRPSACESCEFFMRLSRQCVKCGCFMDLKTELPHAFCPVHKWGRYQAV